MNTKNRKLRDILNQIKSYFLHHIFIGVIFILISMLIVSVASNSHFLFASNLLETIGIALLVSAIFTFTFEGTNFQNKMQSIVKK